MVQIRTQCDLSLRIEDMNLKFNQAIIILEQVPELQRLQLWIGKVEGIPLVNE